MKTMTFDDPEYWRAQGLPGLASLIAHARKLPKPKRRYFALGKGARLIRIIRGYLRLRKYL
jgi:hypothetical protein